jgi:hypothetical protein
MALLSPTTALLLAYPLRPTADPSSSSSSSSPPELHEEWLVEVAIDEAAGQQATLLHKLALGTGSPILRMATWGITPGRSSFVMISSSS